MILASIFVVLLLVAANGFFVAAEFSLVAVRPSRIQQLIQAGDGRARVVQTLLKDLDRVLSGVQHGITMASLALGWLGEVMLARTLEQLLLTFEIPAPNFFAHSIAITVTFVVITALHVVLGELVPKSMALQRAERIALLVARPMVVFMIIFRRVIDFFDGTSNFILQKLGYPGLTGHGMMHSVEELGVVIDQMRSHGVLDGVQAQMFEGVVEVKRVRVHEVMIPRRDIVGLPVSATLDQVLWTVRHYRYDRYPVYENTPETALGIFHAKDIFELLEQIERAPDPYSARGSFDLRRLTREALFVPETRTLGDLLEDFRRRRTQIALVVDEHGSVQGLVTLADIMDEVTGRLADEHAPLLPRPLATETALVLEGKTNLHDLEYDHRIDLPHGEGFETVGGFVLARLGFIPSGGESFLFDGLRFTVLEMEGRRIAKIRIERLLAAQEKSEPAASGL